MNSIRLISCVVAQTNLVTQAAPLAGRLAFASVFILLILWLLFVPSSRLAEPKEQQHCWWRRSRVWAIVVALSQVLLYLLWR